VQFPAGDDAYHHQRHGQDDDDGSQAQDGAVIAEKRPGAKPVQQRRNPERLHEDDRQRVKDRGQPIRASYFLRDYCFIHINFNRCGSTGSP
jgi:hypothetical protein